MAAALIEAGFQANGRQPRFDVEGVLSKALMMFLEFGFDGTSMTQLTEAMGIARPSIYSTFGNKEHLFRKAMLLYHRKRLDYIRAALAEPYLHLVFDHLMRGAQTKSTIQQPCSPLSEFALNGPKSVHEAAFAREQDIHALLAQRIAQAMAAGEISSSIDPIGLSACVMALTDGVALRVRAGGAKEDIAALAGAIVTVQRHIAGAIDVDHHHGL